LSDEIRNGYHPIIYIEPTFIIDFPLPSDPHCKLSDSDLKRMEKIYGKSSEIMKILHSRDTMPKSQRYALTLRSHYLVRKMTNFVRKWFR